MGSKIKSSTSIVNCKMECVKACGPQDSGCKTLTNQMGNDGKARLGFICKGDSPQPNEGKLKELQREDIRKSIIDDLNRKAKFHSGMKSFFMDHLRFVWPWSNDPERKEEDSVKYSMKHTGKDPITFMYDVLTHPEEPHNGILCRPLYNYGMHNMDP